jgi:hypothetical protein
MKRLGEQKPRYMFFLNPDADARFTSCPQCGGKTRQRKLPILIHVFEPAQFINLNKTCRFCPACELLIAQADELAMFFAALYGDSRKAQTTDDYLVVGTIDRADWAEMPATPDKMFAVLHDFKQVIDVNPAPTWVPKPTRSNRRV